MGSRQTTPDLTLSEVDKLVNGAREKLYADIDSLTDWAIEEIENRQGVNGQTVYESTLDVLKELSPSVNKLTDDYYDTVRTIWKQHGIEMADMSHADKVDFARTIWKMAGGTNNTDYPGYTFKQVVEGKAPVRIENLIPQIGSQDDLEQFIGDYIQQHARLSIRDNIENDPTRPRWARIPRGAQTCAFCMMLSSRGFVYHSDESAGAGMNLYHAHCNCQIVPSWGKTRISGYDPSSYARMWDDAKNIAGPQANYKQRLEVLRRLYPEHLKDGTYPQQLTDSTVDVIIQHAIATGKIQYDKPLSAFKNKSEQRDLFVHAALSNMGLHVRVLKEDAPLYYSNIDLRVNGTLWEVKSPTSSNPRSVEDSIRAAKKQFQKHYPHPEEVKNMIFNSYYSGIDETIIPDLLLKMAIKHNIDHIILIKKNGSIQKIR